MDSLTTGWNLLLIIGGFCLLIALHELGHFLAARWAGIRVHAFAIGMGPVVVAWRKGVGVRFRSTERSVMARFGKPASRMSDAELRQHGLGETEYSLRLLPIGGFVGMLGQDDLDPSARSEDPRSYQRAPVGKRMVVVSAGVIANLILAVVLFVIAFMVGVRFESPTIGTVAPTGPAARAGLMPGDRVLSIDGARMLTFADIRIAAAMSRPGAPLQIEVLRPGVDSPIRLSADPVPEPGGGLRSLLVSPALGCTITDDPRARDFVAAALRQAGLDGTALGPGWTVVSVDGAPVDSANQLAVAAASSRGQPLRTLWRSPDGSSEIEVPIPVVPLLEAYPAGEGADGAPIVERGFLGLLPLARIAALEESSANHGVLQPGDVVLRAGDLAGPSLAGLSRFVRSRGTGPIALRVLRDGEEVEVQATISAPAPLSGGFPRLGVQLEPALDVPLMAEPMREGQPASGLRILPLSRLVALDGHPIEHWNDLRRIATERITQAGGAATLALIVESPTPGREHRTLGLVIDAATADRLLAGGWATDLPEYLFDPLFTTLSAHGNPLRAIAMGFQQTHRMVLLTYLTLDRLFRGTVAVRELHGPVGIVHVGTRVADRGFMYLLFFLAMISVNLAVLNFLPLPIVDGGLFLFLVYEKLRGRPPSVAFQNAATIVGLFLIAGVFLLASYNDVLRLLGRL